MQDINIEPVAAAQTTITASPSSPNKLLFGVDLRQPLRDQVAHDGTPMTLNQISERLKDLGITTKDGERLNKTNLCFYLKTLDAM